jgi:predicted permease
MDLVQSTTAFDVVAAFSNRTMAVGLGADTRDAQVAGVSASLLDFFDLRPALGRFFTPAEDIAPSGTNVAVLGHAFWHSGYGGSATVLGDEIRIGETSYSIIGVAPRDFVGVTDAAAPSPAVFVPITAMAYARRTDYVQEYGWSWLEMMVRRRPDVSPEAAAADLNAALVRSWEVQRERTGWLPPAAEARVTGRLSPVQFARGPDARPDGRVAAWVMGVALIVLLIAAANVVNLLLVRGLHRRREVALRLALGVSRPRLVQQVMIETLLLALMGGAAGVLFARWGGGALRALFLRSDEAASVAGDSRTLLFAALLTLALALVTALAPALQALRADVSSSLGEGARDGGFRRSAARTTLLQLQGVLCVVLLVGAGLFVRSLLNVRAYDYGYDVDPIIIVDTNLRGAEPPNAALNALTDRLLDVALSMPGVLSATVAASVPFYGSEGRGAPRLPGRDSLNLRGRYTLQAGSPSYFETTGTRIVRGRGFSDADVALAPPVVVISEAMADAIWPAEDPIGRQLRFGNDTTPMLTVVGVAANITARGFGATGDFWWYLPVAQYRTMYGATRANLIVRVQGEATAFLEPLRQRLQVELSGDAYVRTTAYASMLEWLHRPWRVGATMFVLFATLALVLAAIGLYSVIAYTVAQRTRELGVRIALGASARRVVGMVARQGLLFAAVSIAAGGAAALVVARRMEPLLFGTTAIEPAIYAGVAALVLIVALAATVLPALRATRVDPTIALR